MLSPSRLRWSRESNEGGWREGVTDVAQFAQLVSERQLLQDSCQKDGGQLQEVSEEGRGGGGV